MGVPLGQVGERGLIRSVTEGLAPGADTLLGPGDDAAVVRAADGRVVATTDLLVEDVHFRFDWSTPYDVGPRAAAQNIADVAALGARPTALLVGFAAPATFAAGDAERLAAGIADEARRAGASVVGGDVVAAASVTVAVTALGDLAGRAPVTRAGARPGDALVVVGTLGGSAAGLDALRRGLADLAVVAAHRVPGPPYGAGPLLAAYGATAMIDTSDGLSGDLLHLAEASGVGFEVDAAALPRHPGLAEAAEALGADPLDWVTGGGEDHALVATLPPSAVGAAREACAAWPFAVVGAAVDAPGIRWGGVTPAAPYGHFA